MPGKAQLSMLYVAIYTSNCVTSAVIYNKFCVIT